MARSFVTGAFAAFVSLSALAAMPGKAEAASVNLLTNGGFEDPVFNGSFGTIFAIANIPGWEIFTGSVDLIHSHWESSEPDQNLDMNGAARGGIRQTVSGLLPGQHYRLSFDIAGNPDGGDSLKELTVSLNDGVSPYTFIQQFNTFGHSRASMGWQSVVYDFVAGSSNLVLSFLGDANPNNQFYGPALDNVSLNAVPLPPALALFGTALAGLVALGRRRRLPGA